MILHTIKKTKNHANGFPVKVIEIRYPVVEKVLNKVLENPDFYKHYSELKLGWVGKSDSPLYLILVAEKKQPRYEVDVMVYRELTHMDTLTFSEADEAIRLTPVDKSSYEIPYEALVETINEITECIEGREKVTKVINDKMNTRFPYYILAFKQVGVIKQYDNEFIYLLNAPQPVNSN